MSDILAMRGIILFFFPKMLFRYQFRCRHAHENVPFACMNESRAHETFNENSELA